jgi:hypothetical protein
MYQHDSQVPSEDAQLTQPAGTLDEFALDSGCENGVTLSNLEPGTRIIVVTKNSTYRCDVIDGTEGRAMVIGGSVFPEHTEVRVEGATDGGSVIKPDWVGVGLRLELTSGVKRITTSRVQAVDVIRPLAA